MSINFNNYNDDLLFVPLGGANEIGMNLNLYRYQGKWLMIDCGIGFAGPYLPGIDIVVPNIDMLMEVKKDIVGLVVTHAHEDHLGAVPYLWPEFACPVYTTAFTAAVLKAKLVEAGLAGKVPITEIVAGKNYNLGPFDFEIVPITHSIPEMHAVAVKTPRGTVMHTGDWKLDAAPMVGVTTDEATLSRYGDAGVLAMVCDSTNVFVEGESGSEIDVRASLTEIISQCKERVAVATFSSNVARLETIIYAAHAAGRSVALAGKSIWRMVHAAQESGYLNDLPPFLTDKQGMDMPRNKVVLICTGCQGEARAALSKIARGEHPVIRFSPGDSVIFSSRTIPGNENNISFIHNKLVNQGVEVINDHVGFVHVSGHPARMELERMYALVRPKIAVPVHGEARHIHEHAKLATSLGVQHTVEPNNGVIVNLTAEKPGIIGRVESGYLAMDGSGLIDTNSQVIRMRRKLRDDGMIVVSVAIKKNGEVHAKPSISAPGSLDNEDDAELLQMLRDDIVAYIQKGKWGGKLKLLEDGIRNLLRKTIREELSKHPVLVVHIHEV